MDGPGSVYRGSVLAGTQALGWAIVQLALLAWGGVAYTAIVLVESYISVRGDVIFWSFGSLCRLINELFFFIFFFPRSISRSMFCAYIAILVRSLVRLFSRNST